MSEILKAYFHELTGKHTSSKRNNGSRILSLWTLIRVGQVTLTLGIYNGIMRKKKVRRQVLFNLERVNFLCLFIHSQDRFLSLIWDRANKRVGLAGSDNRKVRQDEEEKEEHTDSNTFGWRWRDLKERPSLYSWLSSSRLARRIAVNGEAESAPGSCQEKSIIFPKQEGTRHWYLKLSLNKSEQW